MRICFLCNEYPPVPHGGIGTFTQIMARALVRAGHEVRVVGMYGFALEERLNDEGVDVRRLRYPSYRLGWIPARYKLFRTVADWAKRREIDIVETPDYEGWAAGWSTMSVPLIARLHGSTTYFAAEMNQPVRSMTRYLERLSLRRADFWCSVSRYTAEKTRPLFGLTSGPHAILHNPIAIPDDASPIARSRTDVMFTGTLADKKGVVPLFRSWSDVLKQRPDAKLHIYGKDGRAAGGGSMREHLESLLSKTDRASVTFHGHQPRERIMQALREARLAVFPSFAEAFAIAPLEAMACGCPTIYSERGSGRELIEHGSDGLLIDPDRLQGIADSIVRLLNDDALAEQLGEAGRVRVRDHFSLEHIVRQNVEFYRESIAAFREGRRPSVAIASAHSPENASAV